jgi:predicted short-subunit dehydrogenase-like oxidoreductase (DUF2520 family)
MGKQAANTIVIIGCGNVAWHLAKQLRRLKYEVLVYNHRSNPSLSRFSSVLGCKTKVGLKNISTGAAFYFVCVSDSAISKASAHINSSRADAMVLHTSGSARLKDLKNKGGNRAVFYPLQTFSKNDVVEWKEIPLIVEVENKAMSKPLSNLAKKFSKQVHFLDQEERLKLHLAAVLVNNFTNTLYVAASGLVPGQAKEKGTDLLLPLLKQTTAKLGHLSPQAAQTGPAKRGDKGVMKKHLHALRKQKDLQKIYRQLSQLIVKQQPHA